jgi:molybdate transport system permease protein
MDGSGARRRDHGLSAARARDPARDGGGRSAHRARGAHAGREPTLPLSISGIATGGLLSFARALGEFGATITFVSNIPGETRTLPLAIYSFTQVPGGDAQAMRLALFSVALSLAALAFSEWLVRRSPAGAHQA